MHGSGKDVPEDRRVRCVLLSNDLALLDSPCFVAGSACCVFTGAAGAVAVGLNAPGPPRIGGSGTFAFAGALAGAFSFATRLAALPPKPGVGTVS
jgi:hypothetical protein